MEKQVDSSEGSSAFRDGSITDIAPGIDSDAVLPIRRDAPPSVKKWISDCPPPVNTLGVDSDASMDAVAPIPGQLSVAKSVIDSVVPVDGRSADPKKRIDPTAPLGRHSHASSGRIGPACRMMATDPQIDSPPVGSSDPINGRPALPPNKIASDVPSARHSHAASVRSGHARRLPIVDQSVDSASIDSSVSAIRGSLVPRGRADSAASLTRRPRRPQIQIDPTVPYVRRYRVPSGRIDYARRMMTTDSSIGSNRPSVDSNSPSMPRSLILPDRSNWVAESLV